MPSISSRLAVHDGVSAAEGANVAIPADARQICGGGGPDGLEGARLMTP